MAFHYSSTNLLTGDYAFPYHVVECEIEWKILFSSCSFQVCLDLSNHSNSPILSNSYPEDCIRSMYTRKEFSRSVFVWRINKWIFLPVCFNSFLVWVNGYSTEVYLYILQVEVVSNGRLSWRLSFLFIELSYNLISSFNQVPTLNTLWTRLGVQCTLYINNIQTVYSNQLFLSKLYLSTISSVHSCLGYLYWDIVLDHISTVRTIVYTDCSSVCSNLFDLYRCSSVHCVCENHFWFCLVE